MKWLRLDDGTTWPVDDNGDPDGIDNVNHKLRYARLEDVESVRLSAASILSAYDHLLLMTNERRNAVCNAIKRKRAHTR